MAHVHVRKLRHKHICSAAAEQEIRPRSGFLGSLQPPPRRTFPGFSRSLWLCAGGWNLRMTRELALLRNARGTGPLWNSTWIPTAAGPQARSDRRQERTKPAGAGEPPPRTGKAGSRGLAPGGPCLRAASSQAPAVQAALRFRGHDLHWAPGSEEGTPDFRALGGGGGGTLASLRTGSGGAI